MLLDPRRISVRLGRGFEMGHRVTRMDRHAGLMGVLHRYLRAHLRLVVGVRAAFPLLHFGVPGDKATTPAGKYPIILWLILNSIREFKVLIE